MDFYGGKSVIVPLPLHVFRKMLEDSFRAEYTQDAELVQAFFEYSRSVAVKSASEQEWYGKVVEKALHWLR